MRLYRITYERRPGWRLYYTTEAESEQEAREKYAEWHRDYEAIVGIEVIEER